MNQQTQTRKTVPPYSEAQVTRWLAFLARGMMLHDQTVFQMEKLQPSWLSERTYRGSYILISRISWGILSGLIYGLIAGLTSRLTDELRDQLIYGLSSGLIVGLIIAWTDWRRLRRKDIPTTFGSSISRWRVLGTRLIVGLFAGIVAGLIYAPLVGPFVGLIIGSIWGIRSQIRGLRYEIKTTETVRFVWRSLLKGFMSGLIYGAIIFVIAVLGLGLIVGLYVGLNVADMIVGIDELMIDMLSDIVFVGLVVGLALALFTCFQPASRELKTVPNLGIWLSLRNAGLMSGVGGTALGVISGLLVREVTAGIAYGAIGGLCMALWYGGLDVIQHFIVRFLLWRAGSLPWRLAPFLDYAAEELHFLQKVGGGYIFVHRYLLEHFAAMETEDGRSVSAD